MKKIYSFAFLIVTLSLVAQTFPIGHMSINFKDAARTGGYVISGGIQMPGTGRDVGAEVYYPATTAGNNTAVGNGQFPVVVIGHGFVMGWDSYDNIYNLLASKGYIVLLPRTEGSASPAHADFGADLKFLANAGLSLNAISTPTSLITFNGKVLQKSAIGGHSMGAGSSFLGAAGNASITCLFNMAAATTNPSSINSASLVTVPTLMISGARDCVADTTVQNSHYSALASAIKFHVVLKQLTHCDFGNGSNFNCTFGQGTSGCGNQVASALAFPRYMNYLERFLANQLKSDCAAGQQFMDSVNTSSSLRSGIKKLGTIACSTTGLQQTIGFVNLNIYPNPTDNILNASLKSLSNEQIKFTIVDVTGKVIKTEEVSSFANEEISKAIHLSDVDNGTYILYVSQGNIKQAHKLIKL